MIGRISLNPHPTDMARKKIEPRLVKLRCPHCGQTNKFQADSKELVWAKCYYCKGVIVNNFEPNWEVFGNEFY